MHEVGDLAGHRWVGRQECGEPAQQGGEERANGDAHISVPMEFAQEHFQAEAQDGSERRIEEGGPVATKLHTESAARKACCNGNHPRRVVLLGIFERRELRLVSVEAPVFPDGSPQHLAHLRDDGEIHAVAVDALVFGEGVGLIAEVHHHDVEVEVNVNVLVRQTQIRLTTV